MRNVLPLLFGALVALSLIGCTSEPEAIDDLSDTTFDLVNHEGESVAVPDDLKGRVVVMGFIYTNCPDFCQMLTANMRNTHDALETTDDVEFVSVTFDPERDTPEVMKDYREAYRVDDRSWQFLTGDVETIDAFMERMNIGHEIADESEAEGDDYIINHSDVIALIDEEGRVREIHNGSRTPVDIFVEDITALQDEI